MSDRKYRPVYMFIFMGLMLMVIMMRRPTKLAMQKRSLCPHRGRLPKTTDFLSIMMR